MPLSNQFLAIPSDHPSAAKLFDLIGLQGVVMKQQNVEAALVNAGGDRASFDRHSAAMHLIDEKIQSLLDEYREERGADETCTVGLTHDSRGLPIVKGRACLTTVH